MSGSNVEPGLIMMGNLILGDDNDNDNSYDKMLKMPTILRHLLVQFNLNLM